MHMVGIQEGSFLLKLLKPEETVTAKLYKEQLHRLNQKYKNHAHTAKKVLLVHGMLF